MYGSGDLAGEPCACADRASGRGLRPPGALLCADGSVLIPQDLAAEVLGALVRDVTARVRADGAQPSASCRDLLKALYEAAHPGPGTGAGSGRGTCSAEPDTIEIPVSDIAEVMGASREYVRRLCRTGALPARKVGGVWLITKASEALETREERPL